MAGRAAARASASRRRGPPISRSLDRARQEKNRQKKLVRRSSCTCNRWLVSPRDLTLWIVAATQEEAKIKKLFEKHDTNKSDRLDASQMKEFMTEYVRTTPGNEEKLVSDAEVKCVSLTSLRSAQLSGGSRASTSLSSMHDM